MAHRRVFIMEKWIRLILKRSHDHSQAATRLHHALLGNMWYRSILRTLDATLGPHAGKGCYVCTAIKSLDELLVDLAHHATFIAVHSLTHAVPDKLPEAMDLLALSDVVRGVSPRGVVRLSEPDGEIQYATARSALEQLMKGYEASLIGGTIPVDLDRATDEYRARMARYTQLARQGLLADRFDKDLRPLVPHEIKTLAEEYQRYNDWATVRTCALALFGPHVHSVIVKIDWGDDGMFPFVEDLGGYGERSTRPMPYDFDLPLFHRPLGHWSKRAFLEEIDEQVGDVARYATTEEWQAARQQVARDMLRDNTVYRHWGLPARHGAPIY